MGSSASAIIEDFGAPPAPWWCDPKDNDPRDEEARQIAVLRQNKLLCPAVTFTAIPNAGRRSQWEARKRKREGMRAGALDLIAEWEPFHPGDRGIAFIEMKDGRDMPTPDQVDELNRLYRHGHKCGVFRQEMSVMRWLRAIGAPFVFGGAL